MGQIRLHDEIVQCRAVVKPEAGTYWKVSGTQDGFGVWAREIERTNAVVGIDQMVATANRKTSHHVTVESEGLRLETALAQRTRDYIGTLAA